MLAFLDVKGSREALLHLASVGNMLRGGKERSLKPTNYTLAMPPRKGQKKAFTNKNRERHSRKTSKFQDEDEFRTEISSDLSLHEKVADDDEETEVEHSKSTRSFEHRVYLSQVDLDTYRIDVPVAMWVCIVPVILKQSFTIRLLSRT